MFSWCVSVGCPTVWEQVLPLYRKDIRNNKRVGGERGRQSKGDRPREGGGGGLSFRENKEMKGEHPGLFILTTKPLPLSPPPPTSEKCPSSTISALQRGTTTNSASLTSHGKHSCLSEFSRGPRIPATLSRT